MLDFGNDPHMTCKFSGEWKEIRKAKKLVEGMTIKIGVFEPFNTRVIHLRFIHLRFVSPLGL
jgi:hypothetical protein